MELPRRTLQRLTLMVISRSTKAVWKEVKNIRKYGFFPFYVLDKSAVAPLFLPYSGFYSLLFFLPNIFLILVYLGVYLL